MDSLLFPDKQTCTFHFIAFQGEKEMGGEMGTDRQVDLFLQTRMKTIL